MHFRSEISVDCDNQQDETEYVSSLCDILQLFTLSELFCRTTRVEASGSATFCHAEVQVSDSPPTELSPGCPENRNVDKFVSFSS